MDFSYRSSLLRNHSNIKFEADGLSLQKTLDLLGQIVGLNYLIIDDQVVWQKRPFSQKKLHTISGYLRDEISGENLIGATVNVKGSTTGVVTNPFGFFALPLYEGEYTLVFSYMGFDQMEEKILLDKDINYDLRLKPSVIELPDIIVSSAKTSTNLPQINEPSLRPSDLLNLPELAGESGLIKGLQSLPGVKTHSDGSAFFYTRGGDKDQNLIIVDDAPIFNPAHLFGFYSMVIPDFTKEIKVYKSDIPTSLGDRLSSIVSIRTKDGNLNQWRISGAVNPFVNRVSLEVPIVRERASIMSSLRTSSLDWLYKKDQPNTDLSFTDFNMKVNTKVGKRDRVFFTVIVGGDALALTATDIGISWGNLASTLRWNHIFGNRLFLNTTLYTGAYNYQLEFSRNRWQSGIGMIGFKTDFTYYINHRFQSEFGMQLAAYVFNPGELTSERSLIGLPKITNRSSRKRAFYYDFKHQASDRLHFRAGLRLLSWENVGPAVIYQYDDQYQFTDTMAVSEGVYKSYVNLDPRLSVLYHFSSTSTFKFAFGVYHQYLQLITNSTSPFTSLEVWLPSGPNIKPQQALQMDVSYVKRIDHLGLDLSWAGYLKYYKNQIDYRPHANTLINPAVEGELRFGEMKSYGLEIEIEKRLGKINGHVNYTWSRSIRKTPSINRGRSYPAYQDRPHDLSILVNYHPGKRTTLSAFYIINTGSTFSEPTGFYNYLNQTVPIYDKKNNGRLPSYRRLDLSLKFRLNRDMKKRFRHELILSAYNILSYKNVVAVNFNKIADNEANILVPSNFIYERDIISTQFDLLRLVPSITYKYEW